MKLLFLLCMVAPIYAITFPSFREESLIKRSNDPSIYPGGRNQYKQGWHQLPHVPGATIDNKTFTVDDKGSFIKTYITENYDPKKIKRAVVIIHGEPRDGWNQFIYVNKALDLAVRDSDFSKDEVVIAAPMFLSVEDLGAYPVDAQNASSSKALIWNVDGWGNMQDAVLPMFTEGKSGNPVMSNSAYSVQGKSESKRSKKSRKSSVSRQSGSAENHKRFYSETSNLPFPTHAVDRRALQSVSDATAQGNGPQISAQDVLNKYAEFFLDRKRFPNLNKLVLGGFSMGGQTINRYIAMHADPSDNDRMLYMVASPGSYLYLDDKRPLPIPKTCAGFNNFKYGLDGNMPPYYHRNIANDTAGDIRARYLKRQQFYLVGSDDKSAPDSSCAANTQGKGHVDRMDNFVMQQLTRLPGAPGDGKLSDNIYYAKVKKVTHDSYRILTSTFGRQALFLTDFHGGGKNAKGPVVLSHGGNGGVVSQHRNAPVNPKDSAGTLRPMCSTLIVMITALVVFLVL